MYCNHCGKENPDGSKVCNSCGLEIQRTEDAVIPVAQATPGATSTASANPNETLENIKEKALDIWSKLDKKKVFTFGGIGLGALAVIILVIVIISSAGSKVSLKKYVADELVCSGINGYGIVENIDTLINMDELQEDIASNKYEDYGYYYYTSVRDYISYEITSENNGMLSNDDEVVITVRINQEGIKENPMFKKKISGDEEQEFKFTVSGLEEGVAIDVFDAVESVAVDTTSYNNLTINLKKDYFKDYGKDGINVKTENDSIRVYGDNFQSFTLGVRSMSDNFDQSKGTHKLVVSAEADRYKEYGIVLAKTETEVKASFISYVTDNTIPAADLAKLTQKAKDDIKNRFPDQNCTLEKTVLYIYDGTRYNNSVVYFFKGTESYYAIWHDNLKQNSDHSIVDIDELRMDTNAWYMAYGSLAEAEQDMLKPVKQFTLSAF